MNRETDVRAWLEYAEADDPGFYVYRSAERLLAQMERVLGWVLDQLP